MQITRRDFLKICGVSAAALGLSGTDLFRLEQALANPDAPTVLWLQGSGCTGCSMSFLNYISPSGDAGDVLINSVNLAYHPNLMTLAGAEARNIAESFRPIKNGYILAIEGSIPTIYNGAACWAWSYKPDATHCMDETFQSVVTNYAANAARILAIGTCAAYGGIPASGSNPTQAKGLDDFLPGYSSKIVNISGCPPHPDWVVWTIAQLLDNPAKNMDLDLNGRPRSLFGGTVHSQCPRNHNPERCLAPKGCRGPGTKANCPTNLWNNATNWCVDANAPCYACTEPTFPGTASLYAVMYNPHGGTDLNCSRCHEEHDD